MDDQDGSEDLIREEYQLGPVFLDPYEYERILRPYAPVKLRRSHQLIHKLTSLV